MFFVNGSLFYCVIKVTLMKKKKKRQKSLRDQQMTSYSKLQETGSLNWGFPTRLNTWQPTTNLLISSLQLSAKPSQVILHCRL